MEIGRKGNLRHTQPTLAGGTQGVMGGKTGNASKDSLVGKNVIKEHIPGKLPQGGGNAGGKGQRL